MVPQSTLVTAPSVQFGTLISICEQAMDRSVCKGVDNTSKHLSDAEKFLSILASLKDITSPVGLPPNRLTLVSFSVLTIASDLDMLDILEACSGMPFIQTETSMRGMNLSIISGTLHQWRDAVVSGSHSKQPNVRLGFNQMHNLFVGVGLGQVWNKYEQQPLDKGYKLIEFKP
jgi:hypothetical protein